MRLSEVPMNDKMMLVALIRKSLAGRFHEDSQFKTRCGMVRRSSSCKWSLRIRPVGLSRIVGTLEIVPLLSQRSLHNWNFTFLNVTRFVLSCMALVAVVPTIVFAIIGKKRLSPLSKPHDRINLNVGLILGILYCSIVVVMLILLERCCNTRTTIGER